MKTLTSLIVLVVMATASWAAEETKLAFDTYSGYFVSNKFEPDAAASFVVINDQAGFDQVFGVAMVMQDKSHRLPDEPFKSNMVVAAIKRGKANVRVQGGERDNRQRCDPVEVHRHVRSHAGNDIRLPADRLRTQGRLQSRRVHRGWEAGSDKSRSRQEERLIGAWLTYWFNSVPYMNTLSPRLFRLERSHVDGEAVLHIRLQ